MAELPASHVVEGQPGGCYIRGLGAGKRPTRYCGIIWDIMASALAGPEALHLIMCPIDWMPHAHLCMMGCGMILT